MLNANTAKTNTLMHLRSKADTFINGYKVTKQMPF